MRTYLDLAGFAEDSVAVEDDGEAMDSCLCVDVERVSNERDGVSTSDLWSGQVHRLMWN